MEPDRSQLDKGPHLFRRGVSDKQVAVARRYMVNPVPGIYGKRIEAQQSHLIQARRCLPRFLPLTHMVNTKGLFKGVSINCAREGEFLFFDRVKKNTDPLSKSL